MYDSIPGVQLWRLIKPHRDYPPTTYFLVEDSEREGRLCWPAEMIRKPVPAADPHKWFPRKTSTIGRDFAGVRGYCMRIR